MKQQRLFETDTPRLSCSCGGEYDDGLKTFYLVCDKCGAEMFKPTRSPSALDRSNER